RRRGRRGPLRTRRARRDRGLAAVLARRAGRGGQPRLFLPLALRARARRAARQRARRNPRLPPPRPPALFARAPAPPHDEPRPPRVLPPDRRGERGGR